MKSYSSAQQHSCTTALSLKNIATAVKKINKEGDQSKKVVVFGVVGLKRYVQKIQTIAIS